MEKNSIKILVWKKYIDIEKKNILNIDIIVPQKIRLIMEKIYCDIIVSQKLD